VARGPAAFVEEERTAWRPFEALDRLTDEELDWPIDRAHDWSGRDLIGHLVAWLGDAIAVANELRVDDRGQARMRSERAFATRGDEINAEIQAEWRALPIAEVRQRLREIPEELRRAVLAVPDARWATAAEDRRFFRVYTIGHYADHVTDLEAILTATGAAATGGGATG